ncbi:hypothetical protein GCM10023322_68850 [Rugosimonospora acidiphila]|uniref:Uncharacterized protein n=1 Tax=Rugosimonospora acidiphila TaxID=556531 RepID=A0ABP9SKD5_9ACTN
MTSVLILGGTGTTGSRAISFGEAVGLIGSATGSAIRHVDIDPEAYVERQVAHGVPPGVARVLAGVLGAIRDGSGASIADGVPRALGRPPRRFEDFVAEAAAAGRWSPRSRR